MKDLKERMKAHAEKVRRHEDMEAVLAGVFTHEAQAAREKFLVLVHEVIKPAFNEFKSALRELDRDAVVITNLTDPAVQSIVLSLVDRYLRFGAGKTLKLVNPKDDVSKSPNTKFYEVFATDGALNVRMRADTQHAPITTQVAYEDINLKFLENELAAFFERAYPAPK